MKREEIPYDKEFDYNKTKELDYSEVSKEKEKADTFKSDLAHYKIVEVPLVREGGLPCYMVARKLIDNIVPYIPHYDMTTNWHFVDGERRFGTFQMAYATVQAMLNQDAFDSAKRKILNNLNNQVINIPNTEKANDWLVKTFWQYVKENEEKEKRIKGEQEKISKGRMEGTLGTTVDSNTSTAGESTTRHI